MDNKKQTIEENLGVYIPLDILNGTLEQVSNNILNIKEKILKIHTDITKYFDFKITLLNEEEEMPELFITGLRLETDKEFKKRLDKALKTKKWTKQRNALMREKRYKEYLKLKKEFENE